MSSHTVSIILWGGLCNRLFQIACCYGYAEKYSLTPIFYKSLFNNNEHTTMETTISIINTLIPNIIISDELVNESSFYVIELSGDFACKYIELKHPPEINTHGKNILLKGYFQSEKYFPILETNKFLQPFANSLSTNRTHDINNNKYFIHMRMGDYTGHFLHYLGYKNYISQGINIILKQNPHAVFMICSNEKDKQKILQEFPPHIFCNFTFECDLNPELNPLTTLENMALCTGGGICLNSSFSWFGAYLSRIISGESGTYIMPDKWFNENYIPKSKYIDIYPQWNNLVILSI